MKRIKFSIKYSKEFELQRVLSTTKRLGWYFENGYKLSNIVLPKNISTEELARKSESEIREYVDEEYDGEFFQPHEQAIKLLFPKYLDELADHFLEIKIEVLSDIEINLTKYGMAGSYNVPNVVIVNISKFFNIGLIRNILHEIIHLHIQNLIDKYNIGQSEKEVIVDNLFEKFFPLLVKEQHYPKDMSKIQEIFKEYYPNLELIVSSVSKIVL